MKKPLLLLTTLGVVLVSGCSMWHEQDSRQAMTATEVHNSRQPTSDAWITTKVKSTFVEKKLFSSADVASMTIHVHTINGVVYLTGTSDNRHQIKNAIRLARSVNGVRHVDSKVMVVRR